MAQSTTEGEPGKTLVEVHTIDHIPEKERYGKLWHQGPFWFTMNATILTILSGIYGGLSGMNLTWSLVAIVLGSMAGSVFAAFHAVQGPRLGIPQMIQSRVQFGSIGGNWVVAVVGFMQLGFAVFLTILGRDSLGTLTGAHNHWYTAVIIVVALAIAIGGYRWLHGALRYLAYLALVVFALVTIALVTQTGFTGLFSQGQFVWSAFILQFGISVGYQIALAPMISNYTRYMPRKTPGVAIVLITTVAAIISAFWFESLGAILATAAPAEDFISSLNSYSSALIPGLGGVVMVLTFLTMIAIVAVDYYEVLLASLTILDTIKRVRTSAKLRVLWLIAIAAIIWILVEVLPSDYLTNYQNFLYLLLYFLIPWTAVNLTDFYLVRKERYAVAELLKQDSGIYGRWNWRGLVAYWIGFLVMIPFFSNALYTGPVANQLAGGDIAPFIGLPVAMAIFWLLMRGYDFRKENELIAIDSQVLAGMHAAVEEAGLAHETSGEVAPDIDGMGAGPLPLEDVEVFEEEDS